MFCPQCGQQQVNGVIRFCSRCGFPLDGVIQLLTSGGMLPVYHTPDEPRPISPRRRGVKQGGVLLLSGILIVSILGMFASFSNSTFLEILAALAAIICFIGGPLRMLYAGRSGSYDATAARKAFDIVPGSTRVRTVRNICRSDCCV